MRFLMVTYERFDVVLSATCPACGKTDVFKPDQAELYAIMDYGLDVTCPNCGEELCLMAG